jgi:uncharacterized protein HemX
MGWRLVIAYGLIAVLIVLGLGMAIYYIRKHKERKRILRGGRPHRRH